jgi:teichoic acid transport system permease protein
VQNTGRDAPPEAPELVTGARAAELAAQHGLMPIAARPPLGTYIREVWSRRQFIVAFASARNIATFADARLGQVWQVLTPLLNAGVYFLIFGLLLNTQRGVHNYIAFLVIGIFVFTYTQRSVLSGSRAISTNLSLIRALHFPRAALPFAYTIIELQQMFVSMIVMIAIVLITGEPITFQWLLLVPILLLQSMFNVGASLFVARIGARVTDVTQLLPFVLRTWLYVSGVFYSIAHFTKNAPHVVKVLLDANPGAVYIELVRDALLQEHVAVTFAWPYAVMWAVGGLGLGFLYFYRAEETYGRG